MKCPNCGSDVLDNSNFCGVCGFDVRAARAAALVNPADTIALDGTPEADAIRAQIQAAVGTEDVAEELKNVETMHDSAPETEAPKPDLEPVVTVVDVPMNAEKPEAQVAPDPADTPVTKTSKKRKKQDKVSGKKNHTPAKPLAPSPAIQSTSIELQVTSARASGSGQGSPHETFASMPAVEAPVGGKFRETQWFMAAQDPDHIDNIGNVVFDDLKQQYKPQENQMDTSVRQKFSLNAGSEGAPSVGAPVPTPTRGDNKKSIVIVLVIVVVVAIAGYFAFGT
jgi:hypothetical protein